VLPLRSSEGEGEGDAEAEARIREGDRAGRGGVAGLSELEFGLGVRMRAGVRLMPLVLVPILSMWEEMEEAYGAGETESQVEGRIGGSDELEMSDSAVAEDRLRLIGGAIIPWRLSVVGV
jgi:hypothetical protein